jgi:hypothetical protein
VQLKRSEVSEFESMASDTEAEPGMHAQQALGDAEVEHSQADADYTEAEPGTHAQQALGDADVVHSQARAHSGRLMKPKWNMARPTWITRTPNQVRTHSVRLVKPTWNTARPTRATRKPIQLHTDSGRLGEPTRSMTGRHFVGVIRRLVAREDHQCSLGQGVQTTRGPPFDVQVVQQGALHARRNTVQTRSGAQFAFREHYQTHEVVFALRHMVEEARDWTEPPLFVMDGDIKKACDYASHRAFAAATRKKGNVFFEYSR